MDAKIITVMMQIDNQTFLRISKIKDSGSNNIPAGWKIKDSDGKWIWIRAKSKIKFLETTFMDKIKKI